MNNNPVEVVGLVSGPIAQNQERKEPLNKHSRLMKAKTHKKVLADSNRRLLQILQRCLQVSNTDTKTQPEEADLTQCHRFLQLD